MKREQDAGQPGSMSRRNFLAGTAAGIGTFAMADRLAMAQAIASGAPALSVGDIQGWGEKPGVVNIGNNENPYGPSPMAVRAIAEDMMNLNRYDWQSPRKLQNAIGDYHGFPPPPPPENPWAAGQSPILVEGGSSFILRQVALHYGVRNGGGEIIEADPAYGSISSTAQLYGRRFGEEISAVRVPLTHDHKHDLDAMLAAVSDRTTLVVVTNPNNPTGTIIPPQEIEAFVEAVPKHVTVFIDEAYIHFNRIPGFAGSAHLPLKHDNVIVSRTFSKIFGLAGLRVGYAVAAPDVTDKLRFFGNSSGIGRINCFAAIAALEDHSFVRNVKRRTNEGKDLFYDEMNALGLEYISSHTSFVLVDTGRDGTALAKRLRERNIILSRLGVTGNPKYASFVRFTIGTPEEMEVAIHEFKKELAS
jgi:histidinol-phosphate aminotransferase